MSAKVMDGCDAPPTTRMLMMGSFRPLANVAGSVSSVMRLGLGILRTLFSPSSACSVRSSARLEASQPRLRPKRLPAVNGEKTGGDGKLAAVDGGTAGVVSLPLTVLLGAAPPPTLTIGE